MSTFLYADPASDVGYSEKSDKPKPHQVPVALTQEGQPVFSHFDVDLKKTLRVPLPILQKFQKFKWMAYDDEVERQRRLLADTALACLALQHPEWVQNAVDWVGKGLRIYWHHLKMKADSETIKKIATSDSASRRIYGPTSFGRRHEQGDKALAEVFVDLGGADLGDAAVYKAQIDRWFFPLDKKPRDVPKLMCLYDYFYCKVLGGTATTKDPPLVLNAQQYPQYQRAEKMKTVWRPDWYEQPGPRGRSEPNKNTGTTSYPGLITPYFTIPCVGPLERCDLDLYDMVEERKRGWDMFSIQAKDMNTDFRKSLEQHNLPFSASASGTTSTLFLAAEAFANISISPLETLKEYLLACVIYLVAGGMHTCHEVFWTGNQVGIDIPDGKYIPALPASFTGTKDYKKWSTEFWEIVRDDRQTVR